MPPRRTAAAVPGAALDAARTRAAEKADTAPHRLTEAEVKLLPGKKVLELGNAGHLRHLGVGTKPPKPATPAAITPATNRTAAQRGTKNTRNARTGKQTPPRNAGKKRRKG